MRRMVQPPSESAEEDQLKMRNLCSCLGVLNSLDALLEVRCVLGWSLFQLRSLPMSETVLTSVQSTHFALEIGADFRADRVQVTDNPVRKL